MIASGSDMGGEKVLRSANTAPRGGTRMLCDHVLMCGNQEVRKLWSETRFPDSIVPGLSQTVIERVIHGKSDVVVRRIVV